MDPSAKPLRIFRPGKFKPMRGDAPIPFSEADLRQMAEGYNAAIYKAPIVIGHPTHDGPAHGWVQGVSFADGYLTVTPGEVSPALRDGVAAKAFQNVSPSFYAPDAPNNPTPGKWALRHVGILGAMPPAAKGLGTVSFADDEVGVVAFGEVSGWTIANIGRLLRGVKNWLIGREGQETADQVLPEYELEGIARDAGSSLAQQVPAFADGFADNTAQALRDAIIGAPPVVEPPVAEPPATVDDAALLAMQQRLAELEAREADLARRQAELDAAARAAADQAARVQQVSFADGLVQQGRLLPRERPMVVEVLMALQGGDICFADGDESVNAAESLRVFLTQLPPRVAFGEIVTPGNSLDVSDGRAIGAAARRLINEAAARGEHLTAIDAVNRVLNQGD